MKAALFISLCLVLAGCAACEKYREYIRLTEGINA